MTISDFREDSTANQESQRALREIFIALDSRRNFKLEAGAGAGKTHSLIDTLRHILNNRPTYLAREGQQVACVTYTNVARNEIVSRTDASPHVFASTIHGFLWEIISGFRKMLLQEIPALPGWARILDDGIPIDDCSVSYDLGFRGINEGVVRLHHDDVPELAIRFFKNKKFRSLIADRFPIILVDEYQDTPAGLAEVMLGNVTSLSSESTYGFFGDHWQQIYDRTCGAIDHLPVTAIDKRANWRSSQPVVSFLNHMRPELPQAPVPGRKIGSVTIYHTNAWTRPRESRSKKGQIPDAALKETLRCVNGDAQRRNLTERDEPLKTLMLTHSSIAKELGFGEINDVFKYNDDYVRKQDEVVAFLLETLEPACEFFRSKKYGQMFDVLRRSRPRMKSHSDKTGWVDLFRQLDVARDRGTVGDVLDLVLKQGYFSPPRAISDRQRRWKSALSDLAPSEVLAEPRRIVEYGKLRDVQYRQIIALREYVDERTPFSTQHGVKGAEYPSVLAVFGGWTRYNFPKMLADFPHRGSLDAEDRKRFERSRNLFYVACSRAQQDLVLLFTTELSKDALQTLEEWVGPANIIAVSYSSDGTPWVDQPGCDNFGSAR
ncbi:DNA helicase-2/ATP-dependent DNA helicase PcrA [Kitasatospora sp. MAP12-15]|uniref:UvrD-helicase domain-containing protein n=1 Tax=unclassified Kitasatospora TaxID=2633591 RepID=UPI002473F1D8|nr:UvrD-helicase domain-containing protein [Kitasatospora sp. MAP12-44]MDH6112551.1 DNA helicase-2/ATP-dependent DNA helicase PcrA [Kitasatospora sp. MAP12-44]